MTLKFRPARPEDAHEVVPLMYSSGPDAYRYIFSVDSHLQALDFLQKAFLQGDGEFGYRDHTVALQGDSIVALVGSHHGKNNLRYSWAAVKQILRFYGAIKGLRVIVNGLRVERIVEPPAKGLVSLHNLAVRDRHRGKGYGEQIIQYFLQQARNAGEHTVCLTVAETNPRAKLLYQRLGFVVKKSKTGGLENRYGRAVGHDAMEYAISRD